MQNAGKRTSRFALEDSGVGNLRENSDKPDSRSQQVKRGHIRPDSSGATFNNQPQWPRTYQNAMDNRIAAPDVTQVFKKIMEAIVWSYAYLLEKKRSCFPDCLS